MVAYGIAKARAMANRTDWNERTEITKAVITWFDADYEYELEIENEDRMDNEEFTAWVEENAESLAKADAEGHRTRPLRGNRQHRLYGKGNRRRCPFR